MILRISGILIIVFYIASSVSAATVTIPELEAGTAYLSAAGKTLEPLAAELEALNAKVVAPAPRPESTPPPSAYLGDALALSLGPAESVLIPSARPYAWPDGNMGVLRSATGSYTFIAASDGAPITTVGTLVNPAQTSSRRAIQNMTHQADYAAGGPVYDTGTGTWLMFYHAERWPANADWRRFYSLLGMAKSTDSGMTWTDLGQIISPHVPMAEAFAFPGWGVWDIGGGAYLVIGDYFYVYFSDLTSLTTLDQAGQYAHNSLAVARAKIDDVVTAALLGNVVTWRKYYDGAWSESGLGGRSSQLDNQSNASFNFMDVSYNTYARKYLLFGGYESQLVVAESSDGLVWSSRRTILTGTGERIYPTIVGTGSNPRVTDQTFYVYYMYDPTNTNRNTTGVLTRHLVTIEPLVAAPPPVPGLGDAVLAPEY
jgi:hypothetical protein